MGDSQVFKHYLTYKDKVQGLNGWEKGMTLLLQILDEREVFVCGQWVTALFQVKSKMQTSHFIQMHGLSYLLITPLAIRTQFKNNNSSDLFTNPFSLIFLSTDI